MKKSTSAGLNVRVRLSSRPTRSAPRRRRETGLHLTLDRRDVHRARRVLAARAVAGTRTGLDADDPLSTRSLSAFYARAWRLPWSPRRWLSPAPCSPGVQEPRGDRFDQRRLAGTHGARRDSDSASCVVAHNFIFLFVHKFILFPGWHLIRLPAL